MKRRLGIVALVGLLASLGTLPARGAHPFYERLLGDGIAALELGNAETARQDLEIAAFGFLDEPPLLARALVYLGLAQLELDQDEGVQKTLRRLVEIEERFGAYDAANLPAAVRADFEERLLASAARDLDRGRIDVARQRAEILVTLTPESAAVRCLRGRLAVSGGDCDAVPDLDSCDEPPADPDLLRSLLACHVEREAWPEARALAVTLPRSLQRDPSFAPLLDRLDAAESKSNEEPDVPTPLPATDLETFSEDDRRRALERARGLLEQARTVEDLEEALGLARRAAEADANDLEAQILAGEIAYRASRWEDAVQYLERAGELENARPEILFFLAVALYETGREERARVALEAALPDLARTPFVNRYVEKILSP